jgi:hypothetical protein
VALGARPREDSFALFFQLGERRIGIGRYCPCSDSLRDRAHLWVREQDLLERREIVEDLQRRQRGRLRMANERSECLLLQRAEPAIQLVSTCGVRAARPRVCVVETGQLDVVDGRNHTPDIHQRFARWRVRRRVDQPDVRRQRKCDPNQAVLAQVAEITCRHPVRAEVIGIDRPEERVVGLGIELAPPLEQLKSRLRARGRELEIVGRHVAVGARPSVAVQAM